MVAQSVTIFILRSHPYVVCQFRPIGWS